MSFRSFGFVCIAAFALPAIAASSDVAPRNPAVKSGLEVSVAKGRVLVKKGLAVLNGREVVIEGDVTLNATAPANLAVKNEPTRLWPDPPRKYRSRTRLFGRIIGEKRHVPHSLVPGSLTIRDAEGTEFAIGQDYILDETWGAVSQEPGGSMKENVPYFASYLLGPKSLDAVILDANGNVRLIQGKAAITNPHPPARPADSIVLAHVYWPGAGRRELLAENIFPVGPPFRLPDNTPKMSLRIPKTMAKLRAGQPVTIVCWGDSVTVGGDASPRTQRYADVFSGELKQRFPRARVIAVAVGGSNSGQWLNPDNPRSIERWGDRRPDWQNVIAPKPDLVTIEFVNDAGLRDWKWFRQRYDEIRRRLTAVDAEMLLITPHFTMKEIMGFESLRENESRPYVHNLRRYAAENRLALADASLRWQHLWREGLPYETLLPNGINHPDNRGHRLFVEELLRCFE